MQEIAFASPKSLRFVGLQQKSPSLLVLWMPLSCAKRKNIRSESELPRPPEGLSTGFQQVLWKGEKRGLGADALLCTRLQVRAILEPKDKLES
jgi:hypothetical protein